MLFDTFAWPPTKCADSKSTAGMHGGWAIVCRHHDGDGDNDLSWTVSPLHPTSAVKCQGSFICFEGLINH